MPNKEIKPTTTIVAALDFNPNDFPGYSFDGGAVFRTQPDGSPGRSIKPRKTNRGGAQHHYHFILFDRFDEPVRVRATAIFPNYEPPVILPPCVEDFPRYRFAEDGTPSLYRPPRRGSQKTDVSPIVYPHSKQKHFRLTHRNGGVRTLGQETLRRMVNGLPLHNRGQYTEYESEIPPGSVRFTEFCDYVFHPDGKIFRVTFPIAGEPPREVKCNSRGVIFIYDSLGRKRGFLKKEVIAKATAGLPSLDEEKEKPE